MATFTPTLLLENDSLPTARGTINANFTALVNAVALVTEIIKPTSGSLNATEVAGTIINNYGQTVAVTLTLPAAAVGLSFRVYIVTSGMGAFSILPASGEQIILNGTALSANHKVTVATPALGNKATFQCLKTGTSTYQWFCNSELGTWTDGGT